MNPANPAEIRIVVAEDHPAVLDGTVRLLKQAGYAVVRASGGEEALAAVRQHRPALLLVARDLPGTDGLEICRQLKRDATLADVFVVILAGDNVSSDETAEGLEAGADGFIARPIADRELLARVAAYVRILRLTRSLRLQAEELRASESKFKGFFEQSAVGMSITKRCGAVQVNPAFCQLLGYSPEEFHRLTWQAVSHPDDVEHTSRMMAELLAGKQNACRFVKRYLHRNGSVVWTDVNSALCRDEAGNPLYFLTTVTDVTASKQMEKISAFLAQTSSGITGEPFFSALARFLAESLEVDSVCIDRLADDGMTVRTEAVWNDGSFADNRTYLLTDTAFGDLAGKRISCFPGEVCQIIPNDQLPQGVRAERFASTTLVDHAGKPNGLISVSSRQPLANRPLVEATLQLVAVRAAGELERQQAEEALRETKDHLENLFGSANAPIVVWDAAGHITRINPAFEKLAGLAATDVLGCGLDRFFTAEQRERAMEIVGRASAGERFELVELAIRHASGSPRTVLWNSAPIYDAAGKTQVATIAQGQDITERKQIEKIQIFLAQTSSGVPGEPFFSALARFLADNLGMDFVCIDRLEGDGLTARTVAVWCDGQFEDNVTYALADTPCGEVVGKHICCFPGKVCQYFPNDQVLQDLRAESYAGTTLFDHTGKPNGLIAVISRQPLANREVVEATLQLVAVRAAGELERQQAEAQLQASEREFRLLADAMPQIVWVCEPEGRTIYCNQQWADYSGLTLEEAYGHGWTRSFHPEDRQRAWEAWQEAVQNGTTYGQECRIRRADGSYRWWLVRGVPTRDADGNILKWFGTCTDIEDLKQGEEALRHSAERFRRIFDEAPMGMAMADLADGRFIRVNAAMCEMLGYSAAELTQLTFVDVTHPEHVAQDRLDMAAVSRLPQGEIRHHTTEKRYLKRTGEIMWGARTLTNIGSPDGKSSYLLAMIKDITQRKEAELALRLSEAKLQALVKNIPQKMFIKGRDFRYGSVNEVYANDLGLPPEAALGKTDFDFFPAELAAKYRVDDERIMRSGQLEELEEKYVLQGRETWIHIVKSPVRDERGEVTGVFGMFWDITAHKTAEVALQREQEFTGALLDNLADGVIACDAHGKLVLFNQAAREWHGLDAVALLPEEWGRHYCLYESDGTTPLPTESIPLFRAFRGETVRDAGMTIVVAGQPPRHIRASGRAFFDAQHQMLGAVVVMRDFTERQRAENELRDSEQRYRSLFENDLTANFVCDEHGRFQTVNPSFLQMFGFPDARVARNHRLGELFPDDSAWAEFHERLHRKGHLIWWQGPLHRADGSKLLALANFVATRTESTGRVEIKGYLFDITERTRTEEALRESEIMLRESQRMAGLGSYALDIPSARWRSSDVLDEVFGIDASFEHSTDGWEALLHPDDRSMILDHYYREVIGERKLFDKEYRIIRANDRAERWVHGLGHLELDDQGQPQRMVGTIQDITERKRAEMEIVHLNQTLEERVAERTAQLAAANREMEAFSYSVSHDLRAPLRAMDGFSAALMEDCAGQLDEAALDHLRRIRAGSQRMAVLIDDLLNLSRESRAEMRRERVDVTALAGEIGADLRHAHPDHQPELVVAPALAADADARMLRVVLNNLLGNAWKFTSRRAGARIEVGVLPPAQAELLESAATVFFVRDNGAGFDMAYADKLFGAFQRLHSQREFAGTGIGLALVQRIVHRHGGRVWAVGKVNEGATFCFTLGAEIS